MQVDVGFGVMPRYLPSWARGAESYAEGEKRVWRACKLLRSESGTLGRSSATLGEQGGRVGELARVAGGLGRGC